MLNCTIDVIEYVRLHSSDSFLVLQSSSSSRSSSCKCSLGWVNKWSSKSHRRWIMLPTLLRLHDKPIYSLKGVSCPEGSGYRICFRKSFCESYGIQWIAHQLQVGPSSPHARQHRIGWRSITLGCKFIGTGQRRKRYGSWHGVVAGLPGVLSAFILRCAVRYVNEAHLQQIGQINRKASSHRNIWPI